MRIALVIPSVNWVEGVPHYTAALGRALSLDHEVHLVAGKFDPSSIEGCTFHKIPVLNGSITLFHATFVTNMYLRRALRSLAPGSDFDIVHGAGFTCPAANVVTCHFIQAREQRLLGYGTSAKNWLRNVKSWDYCLYSAFSSFMERRYNRSLRSKKVVIAISQNVKEDLTREFGIPDERIVVIPNGVDTERFHPLNRVVYRHQVRRDLGLEDEDIVALFVGNSWQRKGLQLAIDALRSIPNPKLKLLVVGAGDPLLYCSPKELSDPDRRVVFLSRMEPQIERYYAAADLLLFPTLYEPFGLVVLEALASGLPVVVSATAGVAEHITDRETGLLLSNPGDASEIRAKLELLLEDSDLRERIALQGRLVAEKLTWDRIASLTLEAYQMALN